MPSITYSRTELGIYQPRYHYSPSHHLDDVVGATVEAPNGAIRALSKTWVRTPNYWSIRKGKRRGFLDLPMNDFTYSYEKIISYGDSVVWTMFENPEKTEFVEITYAGDGNATIFGSQRGPNNAESVAAPVHDFNLLDDLAKNKVLLGLKDQKVNLVQAFAEREQTVRMMTSTLLRFTESVTSLKRGDIRGAARALGISASRKRDSEYRKRYAKDPSDAVSSGWLELQYGWRPLLSDIYGAAELVAQTELREIRNKVSIGKTDTQNNKRVVQSQYGHYHHSSCESKATVKYTIWYSTDPAAHSAAQLGITNPLLIAWELTPWSFVIDWFIPIGNYISSLDATYGLKFEKGCKVTFQKITFNSKTVPGSNAAGDGFVDSNCRHSFTKVMVTRSAISAFPSPPTPTFKNPLSFTHFANALALATQSFKGK